MDCWEVSWEICWEIFMFKPGTSGAVNDATRYLPETPLQVYNYSQIPNARVVNKKSVRITPKYSNIFLMSL